MFKISDIVEGWRNDLFPPERLKEVISKVSEERLAICKQCELYDEVGTGCAMPFSQPCCNKNKSINGIDGCGCPLRKKTKCLSCECPVKKWLAVVTEEEQEQFKLTENGK